MIWYSAYLAFTLFLAGLAWYPCCEPLECDICAEGTVTELVQVDIGLIGNEWCDGCSVVNGAWVIPQIAPCEWEDTFDIDIGDNVNPLIDVCGNANVVVNAKVGAGSLWTVKVTVNSSGTYATVYTIYNYGAGVMVDDDCSEPSTLSPGTIGISNSPPCDFHFNGTTCTVTPVVP